MPHIKGKKLIPVGLGAFLIFLALGSFVTVEAQVYASGSPQISTVGANTQGQFQTFSIPTPNSGPNAIVAGPNRTFWFVEFTAGKIGEFFEQNNTFKEFQIPEPGAVPASLALDRFGIVWFSDQKNNSGSVWSFNPRTGQFRSFQTPEENSKPLFILIDNQSNVWFTEILANKIGFLTYPNYNLTEYALPTASSEPVELSFGTNQSIIWITETNTGRIASFNTVNHSFKEYTPPRSVSDLFPVGIAVDREGNVWFSEHGGSAVLELIPSNSTFHKFPTSISPASGYPISAVATLAIDHQGRLWFVEHFSNKIGRLDPSNGEIQEFKIPSSEPAYSVLNAIDARGNFWFTNFGAGYIGEILSNSTSPIVTKVEAAGSGTSNALSAGTAMNASVSITNILTSPIEVTLNASSTFSPTGVTNSQQVRFNASSFTIPANGKVFVNARIEPSASLSSGIYSVGIVATSGNYSSVGILFLSVKGQFSITQLLESNYQFILIAIVAVLIVAYFAMAKGRAPRAKTARSLKTA